LKDGIEPGFNLYDLSERVRIRGWQIASYPLPSNREKTVVQRILIRHGVSRDLISLLLDELKRGIEDLRLNPVRHSNAGPTFSHGATPALESPEPAFRPASAPIEEPAIHA